MRIVLLGPPGSGKAELSKKIAEAYKIPILTQAGVVDSVAAESSELGRLAADARDASRVSDELLLALLRIQLPKMDLSAGYLLVDMPRDSGQADVLDSLFDELAKPVDLVIKLDVDMDELMERLVGRIQCDHCGAEYNLYVNPPMVDGVCDECGARVRRRPDDYEETISNRLRVYDSQMGPLLQYYEQAGKLHRFDASGGIGPLWRKVKALIDITPSLEVVAAEPGKPESGGDQAVAKSVAAKGKKGRKKAAAKKVLTEKASAKKVVAKKAPARKKVAKKAVAKKVVTKKAAKKVTAKKVAKKAVAKKATKKVAAKTQLTRKTAKKKVVSKKVAKKATAKKAVRKAAVKKNVAVPVSKKKAAKKKAGVVKKVAKKKSVAKKMPSKKVVAKKAAKKVARKPARR